MKFKESLSPSTIHGCDKRYQRDCLYLCPDCRRCIESSSLNINDSIYDEWWVLASLTTTAYA
jgi:hypothetical protein